MKFKISPEINKYLNNILNDNKMSKKNKESNLLFSSLETENDYNSLSLYRKKQKNLKFFEKFKKLAIFVFPYILSLIFFVLFLSKRSQYESINTKYNELNLKVLDHIFSPYHSDLVTSLSQLSIIKKMIRKSAGYSSNISLRLVYKASVHGDTASSFHKKLEGFEKYVIIIKDDRDNIFGGFTSKNFDFLKLVGLTMDTEIQDDKAFLFSLTLGEMYTLVEGKEVCAVQGDEDFGPIFGNDGDIWVVDNFFSKNSFSRFPSSYTLEGKDKQSIKYRFTQGREKFLIKELEAFQVYIKE